MLCVTEHKCTLLSTPFRDVMEVSFSKSWAILEGRDGHRSQFHAATTALVMQHVAGRSMNSLATCLGVNSTWACKQSSDKTTEQPISVDQPTLIHSYQWESLEGDQIQDFKWQIASQTQLKHTSKTYLFHQNIDGHWSQFPFCHHSLCHVTYMLLAETWIVLQLACM